jgi:4-hydroxy-3-methylbut-2-enyl diphosphate reductase
MVLLAQLYADILIDIKYGIISALYIFVMYSVNNYLDRSFLIKSNSYKYKIYDKYGSHLLIASIISFIASLYLAMTISISLAILMLIPYIFGLTYSTPAVKRIIKKLNLNLLKKVYNTKIVTGLGWLVAVIVIPYYANEVPWEIYFSAGLFFFTFVFIRHLIIDFVALQGDLILGRDTLPTWLGVRNAIVASYIIIFFSSIIFAAVSIITNKFIFLLLLLCILYYVILLKKMQKISYLISLRYEFIIDLNYFILAIFYVIIRLSPVLL